MRRWAIWGVFAAFLVPVDASAQSRAMEVHRPADGIRGFITGCLTSNPTPAQAKAGFDSYNLAESISNRPNGNFPAGQFATLSAQYFRRPFETTCQVRIRSLWLSSADPAIAKAAAQAGFTQIESRAGTERVREATVEYGPASGVYRHGRDRYLLLVFQTKQRAGRTTELFIGRLRG